MRWRGILLPNVSTSLLDPFNFSLRPTRKQHTHMYPIPQDIRASCTRKVHRAPILASHSTNKQIRCPRIRPRNTSGSRIRDGVVDARVAVSAVEQHIRPISGFDQRRGLGDARVGKAVVVEEGGRGADESVAVRGDGLQEDGRGHDGRDGVAADAAVAEGVAVDLSGWKEGELDLRLSNHGR